MMRAMTTAVTAAYNAWLHLRVFRISFITLRCVSAKL